MTVSKTEESLGLANKKNKKLLVCQIFQGHFFTFERNTQIVQNLIFKNLFIL